MLAKKFWIPIVMLLIGFAIGSTFLGQHIASQEPVKIINPVTAAPVDGEKLTISKPPPPGETAESGHWHGNVWHAETHAPVEPPSTKQVIEPVIRAADMQNANAETQTNSEAEKQDILYQKRKEQYLKDRKAWRENFEKAYAERLQVIEEAGHILPPAEDGSYDYIKHLSDAEKREILKQLNAYMERYETSSKKEDTIFQARPVLPAPPEKK